MAMSPLKLAVNGVTDPARKASLTDDDYLEIDDMLSTTGNSGVKSALLQSIRFNDLELSHTEDITPGYSGQATSCASTGQSEEPFEDIHHVSELAGTNHGKLLDLHACRHRLTRLQQIFQTLSNSPRERSSNYQPDVQMATPI